MRAIALLLLMVSPVYAAERIGTVAQCTTEAGSSFVLAANSLILSEQEWSAIDFELKRLGDQETRLTAENRQLTLSLRSQNKWRWFGYGLLAGATLVYGGMAIAKELDN